MTANEQNNREWILDQLERGLITTDQANVLFVRCDRVKLITAKLPASVRAALNAAVKRGELAHMKKDGLLPEAYYHPTFPHLANEARRERAARAIEALKSVLI